MSYRNEELLEKQKSNEIDTLNCTTVSCDVEPSSDWSKWTHGIGNCNVMYEVRETKVVYIFK